MLTVNPKRRIDWSELLNYYEKLEKNEVLKNVTNYASFREKAAVKVDNSEVEYKNLIKERNKVMFLKRWCMPSRS